MSSLVGTTTKAEAKIDVVEEKQAEKSRSRQTVFLHSLAFVFGFGVVFTLLGSAAGLLGRSLFAYQLIIQRVGAVLLIIFGLTTIGVFRWLANFVSANADLKQNVAAGALVKFCNFLNTLLYTERRVTEMHDVNRGWGYVSSFAIGVSFSAGWVPCIGPILASILFLASDSATAAQGAILLAVYSLGLGIPFLLTGAAFGTVSGFLRKMNRYMGAVSVVSGLFMLIIGYYLWTNQLVMLTAQFSFLNNIVFGIEDWVSEVVGFSGIAATGSSVLTAAPLALFAGIISFISPCVLPLVPAYIGYLSGTTLNSQ